jgi:hypothetical protein
MRRLGYTRHVAQGGDVGAVVTDTMGRQAPEGLIGVHMNLLVGALSGTGSLPVETDEERAAAAALAEFRATGNGCLIEQATRPQTIGYALLDSPVALAAWMLDHDTDSYDKISRAFPGEIFQAPRTWVEHSSPNVIYFNKPDRGGHFATWEEPDLFATKLRAAFRSLG